MAGKPIPKPSFLDQCTYLGVYSKVKRWRSKKGDKLYTWDPFHGEIEVYNKLGKHLGVINSAGDQIKPAVKVRTIDV